LCGQPNIEPNVTLWQLIVHFFEDITHFDGKFFKTVKYLFKKPGFLPAEFMKGRRARYLDPVRMYLFTSAVFFLFIYSMSSLVKVEFEVNEEAEAGAAAPTGIIPPSADSIIRESFFESRYTTVAQYDSVQNTLPESERDGWVARRMAHKSIERNKRYDGRQGEIAKSLLNGFISSFPYLLFVSLPLYALYLKFLYFRNNRLMYAGHGVFLVYLYIFSFILFLFYFILDKIAEVYNVPFLRLIQLLILIFAALYTLMAMKRFYGEDWATTVLKFFIFNFLSFISAMILFIAFFMLTLMRV
jgi:hypothetical protein